VTERWRKKLEGIDQVAPRDDVYERAKAGPTLPESRSPMQRTSTRVATAIAAFVVFALAISLFAIPTLRLGGEAQSPSIGGQLQPLWPWSTTAAVEAWRADPQSIGTTSVEHFSAPDEVAAAFGRQIFGSGTEVWAHEVGTPTAPIACAAEAQSLGPTLPSSGASAINPYCSIAYPSGSSETILPDAPTSAEPAFRTFDLSVCPPNAACDWSFPGPPNISVTVYRPIGVDGPWAVLEAASDYVDLSISAGTSLGDGSTVSGSGMVFDGFRASLGYRSTSDSCPASGTTTPFEPVPAGAGTDQGDSGVTLGSYSKARLDVHLPVESASCADQPGYVFIVLTDGSFDPVDPLAGIPEDTRLLAFVAAPVSLTFPVARETTSPSPTAVSVPWTTYTDPLGWTIDVPDGWSTGTIAPDQMGSIGAGGSGAWFSSGEPLPIPSGVLGLFGPDPAPGQVILRVFHDYKNPVVTDDSPLPLDADALLKHQGNEWDGFFIADGLEFGVATATGGGGSLSQQQHEVIWRMISSIRFQPWTPGETRGDPRSLKFTALDPTANRPAAWKQAGLDWQELGGLTYVYMENGENGVLLGPMPSCGADEVHDAGTNVRAALLECADGTKGGWTIDGQPLSNNSPNFLDPVGVNHVVRAWDGTLLSPLVASQ